MKVRIRRGNSRPTAILPAYKQVGDAWYLADELSQGRVVDGNGTFDHVDVQFLHIVDDPHDDLDFGLSSSLTDAEIVEPPESFR